ncbi:MAG: helix-turn-helix domain-containing protein [Lachnospiraceae bacterium]|nr:helix-turn-helix domain-containing protein [Lachnospiraceae bacterium]
MTRSRSFVATPPGATIKEQLVDRGMNQKEFAARMEMSEKHISKLINGEVQLTSDVSVRLEMVLGAPAQFWSNLEVIYREKLVKVKNENEMDEDLLLIKKLPYAEMAKHGWVPATKRPEDRVIYSRKFFEVVNLDLVKDPRLNRIACRRIQGSEKSDYALLAWAQKAKLEARQIETAPINMKALKECIPEIRSMTTMDPTEFCPKLTQLLAECGVALVFLPHIGGSFLHGASFCDGNKIVVGMTVRGKDADKFWFSLFHELAHVLYGHIHQVEGTTKEDEDAADLFARDTLISPEEFSFLLEQRDYSKDALRRFAAYSGVDVGIVVGRLQKEEYIDCSWYNDLKVKYELER